MLALWTWVWITIFRFWVKVDGVHQELKYLQSLWSLQMHQCQSGILLKLLGWEFSLKIRALFTRFTKLSGLSLVPDYISNQITNITILFEVNGVILKIFSCFYCKLQDIQFIYSRVSLWASLRMLFWGSVWTDRLYISLLGWFCICVRLL